jgi:hypothetical protein
LQIQRTLKSVGRYVTDALTLNIRGGYAYRF